MRPNVPPLSVSIVTATSRLGGLDVLAATVERQTFRDFEVILVDYWWEERHGLLDLDRIPNLVHVPPRLGRWREMSDAHNAWNTGLALARGNVVCFLSDYWLAHPRYVEDHYQVWKDSGGRKMLSGQHDVRAMPELASSSRSWLFSSFAEPIRDAVDAVTRTAGAPTLWSGNKANMVEADPRGVAVDWFS